MPAAAPYDRSMLRQLAGVDGRESSPAIAQSAMIEALVAGEGLDRVAAIAGEHAGGRVGIFIPRPGTDGCDGSAAERFVAELVDGGDPRRPDEIHELAPIVCGGEMLGAVALLEEAAPEAGEYLRAAAAASLTAIAMMNARDETARDLSASFLSELISRRDARVDDVLRRAGLLGRDLSEGIVALCAEPADERPARLATTIDAHCPQAFAEVVGERVLALVPGGPEAAARLTELLAAEAGVGVSSHYRDAGEARTALEEAQLLLDAGAGEASSHTFRLLFRLLDTDPATLRRFAEGVIGPLARYDRRHATELGLTLGAYLERSCNIKLTAAATYTHRHTISNRLAKIHELTGLDPQQGEDRELLGLALKAHRVAELRPAAEA